MGTTSDVSQNLDIIAQITGDMLARGVDGWERLAAANEGWPLFAQGVNLPPIFRAGAAGVRLEKTLTQTAPASALTAISWDAAIFDDASFWDVADPTRITVPAGVSRIELTGGWFSDTAGTVNSSVFFRDQGGAIVTAQRTDNAAFIRQQLATGPLPVVEADWFELVVQPSGTKTIGADPRTFFSAQVVRAA